MSGSLKFKKNVWYDLPTKCHTQNTIKHLMLYTSKSIEHNWIDI